MYWHSSLPMRAYRHHLAVWKSLERNFHRCSRGRPHHRFQRRHHHCRRHHRQPWRLISTFSIAPASRLRRAPRADCEASSRPRSCSRPQCQAPVARPTRRSPGYYASLRQSSRFGPEYSMGRCGTPKTRIWTHAVSTRNLHLLERFHPAQPVILFGLQTHPVSVWSAHAPAHAPAPASVHSLSLLRPPPSLHLPLKSR